jgi:hypothetical protein
MPASFLRLEVENRGHFTADTWRARLEAWFQPQNFGLSYWANVGTGIRVELLTGLLDPTQQFSDSPQSVTSLITGQVDDIDIDPITGELHLSGRDLSALLIDTKTSNKWPDQTASQIATKLFTQVGLTPQVTATDTPVGQYYDSAYAHVAREIPMWDLLCFLAQQEGFDLYVVGTTGYFGPPEADSDPNPWTISVQKPQTGGPVVSNVANLKLRRSLTLAGDISVTVLSHSGREGKSIKATATRAGKSAPQSSASKGAEKVQNFTLRRPNLTQEQAQQLANSYLADLTKLERTFEATCEGDPTLSVRRKARITNTGTSFDQDYYLFTVHHTLSFEGGYEMVVQGKNHPVVGEPGIA